MVLLLLSHPPSGPWVHRKLVNSVTWWVGQGGHLAMVVLCWHHLLKQLILLLLTYLIT